jgi:hypothetical protein
MQTRLLLLLTALLAIGCGTSEEDFAEDLGTRVCKSWNACFPIDRTSGMPWDTYDECLEEEIGRYEDNTAAGQAAGCTFDEEAAEACLKVVRQATCDELMREGLDNCVVWDCPDDA